MRYIKIGNTGLTATAPALGCLPLQRMETEDAVRMIRKAYDGGIRFFDTANGYTDSEKKLGLAFKGIRENVVIATKSMATDKETVLKHIENSLNMLQTDYIDIFQFHWIKTMPDPNDPNGSFAAALEAKKRGWIRHIGVTTHMIQLAEESIDTGYFEVLQFPFSYISAERDIALAEKCEKAGMGFIAMKGLAGGLLTNARACHAFMNEYPNVIPIWGMQSEAQLDEWLALADEDPHLDDELKAVIAADRASLGSTFCRGCNYCAPCPVGIEIFNCARMNMLLRRSPYKPYLTDAWKAKMNLINDCLECGSCKSKCPYGLDTPELLKYMLKDYNQFYEEHKHEL